MKWSPSLQTDSLLWATREAPHILGEVVGLPFVAEVLVYCMILKGYIQILGITDSYIYYEKFLANDSKKNPNFSKISIFKLFFPLKNKSKVEEVCSFNSHKVPLELVVALMKGLTPRMRTKEEKACIGQWEEKWTMSLVFNYYTWSSWNIQLERHKRKLNTGRGIAKVLSGLAM